MAMYVAGIQAKMVNFRLRDKPPEMLALSPKGTVPVLHLNNGAVMDDSLTIMIWALKQADMAHVNDYTREDLEKFVLPTRQGKRFKMALDRYKYPDRYPDEDTSGAKDEVLAFLEMLEEQLNQHAQLLGNHITLVDWAVFPFIRQCANTDRAWFDALPLQKLQAWLAAHIESDVFQAIFKKEKEWLIEG